MGGIEGIAFELHANTSSANDLCMWGGASEYCSFNQLVDYTDIMARCGYRFAITGLLLEMPQRQCRHEPSAAIVDNSVVIIGQVKEDGISQNPFVHLSRPLSWAAWIVVGFIIFVLLAVCLSIAVRLHYYPRRSLVTAFFIFTGQNDLALQYEMQTGNYDARATLLAMKYSISMTLFRYAVIGFCAIFMMFYQAAIVNFLFFQDQQEWHMRRLTSLTRDELRKYSVLNDSALEQVWKTTGKFSLLSFQYCCAERLKCGIYSD